MITEKENILRILTGKGNPEWIPICNEAFDVIFSSEVHERPPFGADGYDWYGIHWVFDKGFHSFVQDPAMPLICNDITKWKEQIRFPDYSQYDWEAAAEKDLANVDRENKLVRIFLESGAWERLHALVGFEEAFIYMYDEPEAFKELMQALTDSRAELIRILHKYYHADAIFDQNDLGSSKASFMSPDMYVEFIQPYQKQLVDLCHELGMFYIMHSCGTVENLIGEMIKTGTDVINPIQGCNNWEMIRDQYAGQVVFEGARHLSSEEVDAKEEDIRADIRNVIDIFAPSKRFIFDDYCMLPRNQGIMIDEAKKYGKDFWKR